MKIFAIVSLARQVDGEFCLVKTEKAFMQATKAEEFLKTLSKNFTETIQTPFGAIPCVCERGIFEIDVEE